MLSLGNYEEMIELIVNISNRIGVEASILLAICSVESDLRNTINYQDGKYNSYGVCQVQRRTAQGIKPHLDAISLMIPEVNIEIAAIYLKQRIDKYGTLKGIAAYNSGSPKYKNNELINKEYVNKVLKRQQLYASSN